MNSVSNLAFVHPEAKLGDNVIVEPFAFVDNNTVIGDGTRIMSHSTIFMVRVLVKIAQYFPCNHSRVPRISSFKVKIQLLKLVIIP